jgi:hypothetical protein
MVVRVRQAIGVLVLIGWVFVFFLAPEFQEDLPALRDHFRQMQEEYPALSKVKDEFVQDALYLSLSVSSPEETEEIKEDLQEFLSGEDFLAEFLPWYEAEMENSGSSGLVPRYPDIYLVCTLRGGKEILWTSHARYYTQPYRSDQVLEVDGYQTWYTE